MNSHELTNRVRLATIPPMWGRQNWHGRLTRRTQVALGVLAGSALAMGGCVSVNAPDKPIVIELNINIKQEVIYRLAADAGNTIEDNKDIF